MAILNIQIGETGLVGVIPQIVYIKTNDTLATVTTAGYLNKAVQQGFAFSEYDMALVSTKTSPSATDTQVGWLEVSKSGSNWSLVPIGSPGSVVLPTVANQIVHATNATGTLSTDAANVVNLGNITAGSSAVAGSLTSFAGTGTAEFLRLAAINNTGGNFSTTISNTASVGQSQTISIPNAGGATANFAIAPAALVNDNLIKASGVGGLIADAGIAASAVPTFTSPTIANHIAVFTNTTGNLGEDVANAINEGNIIAGVPGSAGTFISIPPTAVNGSLILKAINAGGAFDTTISNSAMLQSSVVSIPDPGAATANFIVSGLAGAGIQHITSGSLEVDAGSLISGIGTGGFIGLLKAFPTTATSGFIAMQAAVNASGDFGTTISNATAQAQATVLTIPDVGAATGFLNPQTVTANLTPAGVLIKKDITLGFAALAAAGQVTIQAALATAQFKVRDIFVNYGAAGLSGGGGDRLVTVTDGTTVYNNAGITAALLGTPVNTVFGGTGNPLAGTVSQETATVAGAKLYAVYSGGAADYTAGSVVITVTYERVA